MWAKFFSFNTEKNSLGEFKEFIEARKRITHSILIPGTSNRLMIYKEYPFHFDFIKHTSLYFFLIQWPW